jgi:hypothetical protein
MIKDFGAGIDYHSHSPTASNITQALLAVVFQIHAYNCNHTGQAYTATGKVKEDAVSLTKPKAK